MKKKRIFIAIHYMEIGGVERSLLGLLTAINADLYDVDLFVYSHRGEFMPFIPSKINLLKEYPKYTTLERPIKDVAKEGYWDVALARLLAKFAYRYYMKRCGQKYSAAIFQYVADYTTYLLPTLKNLGVYDLAISFMHPHNIVLEKVQAKKKIAWIHTDYSMVHINRKQEIGIWEKYDNIISISDNVTNNFLRIFPEVEDKIVLIENILSPNFVRKQADLLDVLEEMKVEKGTVKLCSVGRFSYPKNFDNIPIICKQILDFCVNIKWFIIGYGGDENLIKEHIRELKMEQHVILLGKKTNPYPYIKACDIYVQPSRYEGKAVTVREAQMLCKPVVITDFPTSKSQLLNGFDGIIVPMDILGAAQGIRKLIENKHLQLQLSNNCSQTDYGNFADIEKLYNLI